MKFSESIEIDRPVETVVRLFTNPDHLGQWMDGFQNIEHLSGTPGTQGAKSRLTFQTGKRKMEMTETITAIDLPKEMSFTYDAGTVFNTVRNRFEKLKENRTRLVVDTEYRFKGIMKFIAPLMSGVFKKQTRKYLGDFKEFAENQAS
ncbi:SRPBCC family protein [Sinomicrobium weinanense]|uniref:SRPBCC family protein n=1 Tax=Sinomicrobium weinanense TaxID=2842200 RepID=A0A926JW97_9FLAO|nr:SRPBCC family protein [Sinomicrobium weinanense]MBC9798544.1 SRPBCC family protein [Sinomicrobium weinanense]MBU3122539.1 SRPBCC family protein [Sinomicrobium weinanense]